MPVPSHTYHRVQRGTHFHALLFLVSLLHLDPDPTIRKGRDGRLDPNLLNGLPSWAQRPRSRRLSFRIRVHVQRYPLEGLDEASDHCGRFAVCELLSETNSRSGIEWKEDEGVGNEVPLDSFIQEPVRIEFFRYRGLKLPTSRSRSVMNWNSPSGPQRSFLRCINQGR